MNFSAMTISPLLKFEKDGLEAEQERRDRCSKQRVIETVTRVFENEQKTKVRKIDDRQQGRKRTRRKGYARFQSQTSHVGRVLSAGAKRKIR
jgi:hypothetical protein